MRCVLGIDAAWTAASPSGCALVVETETGWRLVTKDARDALAVRDGPDWSRSTRVGGFRQVPVDRNGQSRGRSRIKGSMCATDDEALLVSPVERMIQMSSEKRTGLGWLDGRECKTG